MIKMIGMKMENEIIPEMEDCPNCGHSIEHTPDHWILHWSDWSKDWSWNLVTKSEYDSADCETGIPFGWQYSPTKADAIFQIKLDLSLPIHVTQKNGIEKVIN